MITRNALRCENARNSIRKVIRVFAKRSNGLIGVKK